MAKVTLNDLASLTNEQSAINQINNNNDLIETAIENTLSRDGTSPNEMEATLDMNSNRIINLPEPVNLHEAATKEYVDSLAFGGEIPTISIDDIVGISEDGRDLVKADTYADMRTLLGAHGPFPSGTAFQDDAVITYWKNAAGHNQGYVFADQAGRFRVGVYDGVGGSANSSLNLNFNGEITWRSENLWRASNVVAQAEALRTAKTINIISSPATRNVDIASGTTITNAMLNAYLNDLPTAGGEIVFPPGSFPVDPITFLKSGVTIRGFGRATKFVKRAADTIMFQVGNSSLTEGTRIQDFNFLDFMIDGDSIDDNSDDYPHIQYYYCDGGLVDGVDAVNGSTLVRLGRGPLTWSLSNQRSRYIEVRNFRVENMRYFGIEGHGYYGCRVHHGLIEGGARSTGSTCAGIRSVKGYKCDWDHIRIDAMGKGLLGTGGSTDEQGFITFDHIDVAGSQYGYGVDLSGPWRNVTLNHLNVRGHGSSAPATARLNMTDAVKIAIRDSIFEAGSADCTDILRIDGGGFDGEIQGCTLENRFTGQSVSTYGIRLNDCGGIWKVIGNTIDTTAAASNSRLLYSVSPRVGFYGIDKGNVFVYETGATLRGGTWNTDGAQELDRY